MMKSDRPHGVPPKPESARPFQRHPSPDNADNTPPNPDLPSWLLAESDVLGLPEGMKEALNHIVIPAYRALVLDAPGELERTIGNSVVYLTWIELVNQIRLANTLVDSTGADAILHDPDELTDRCLQLITAKCQAAGLMLKIRVATEALNRPVRQAFQPDTASPQATTKFKSAQSADQLAAEARRPKSENPPFVDQLNRPVPSDSSSPKAPGKLENQESVDQLQRAVAPNPSSSEYPGNGN